MTETDDVPRRRRAHRVIGARRRIRKPALLVQEQVPAPQPLELHRKLRNLLADGPMSLGALRRVHGFDPITLLRETIGQFPEVYQEVDCDDGHPGLALRPNIPPLDVQLDRRKLLPLIRAAGENGVYLSSLHKASGYTSRHVEEVLEGATGLERLEKNGRPLYRFSGLGEPEDAPEQPIETLENARDQLLTLLGASTRMAHWLIDGCHFDAGILDELLLKFPDDFLVEEVDAGTACYKLISARSGPVHHAEPAEADTAGPPPLSAAPQANLAPALLSEVMDKETLAALRFRPAAPHMVRRRNGPVVMRGDRSRVRRPLVQL